MEALVFLLLIVIAVCFVVPLVAIAKAGSALRSVKDFETRLRGLEAELQMLRRPHGEPTKEETSAAKEERETAEGETTGSPSAVSLSSFAADVSSFVGSPCGRLSICNSASRPRSLVSKSLTERSALPAFAMATRGTTKHTAITISSRN